MAGADIPHPVDLVRLAASADGYGDAESFRPLPDRVATGVVWLGLALKAHAVHAVLVDPIRELFRGIGGSRVQDTNRDCPRGVKLGAVALVDVVQTVGGIGLHQSGAFHAGVIHLFDQVFDVVADLGGPASRAEGERVLDLVAANYMGVGVDNHG